MAQKVMVPVRAQIMAAKEEEDLPALSGHGVSSPPLILSKIPRSQPNVKKNDGDSGPEVLFSLSPRELLDKLQTKLEDITEHDLNVVFREREGSGSCAIRSVSRSGWDLDQWLDK